MNRTKIALVAGPLAAVVLGVGLRGAGYAGPLCWTVAITVWVSTWWILQPIPIAATSLIPFAAFPLAGVLTHDEVARAYGDSIILLFLGGFLLSSAMERSGTHRRLALNLVRAVGGDNGRRIVFGFMLASAALSMWISNAATALMLLPVALAVLEQTKERETLGIPLLLGLAYGTSIGGIGTPVGTPPNMIFIALYRQHTGYDWSFVQWMSFGVPIVALLLPVTWLWITRGLRLTQALVIPHPGAWRAEERRVLIVFGLTALLWVFRTAPLGGWNGWLERQLGDAGDGARTMTGDSTVALLMALVLFLIPNGRGGRILDGDSVRQVPWDILLLFGGGLAIGAAFKQSGLSQEIGHLLSTTVTWNLLLMIAVICLAVTFLTEIMSNTAVTNILLPILAGACLGPDGRWLLPPEMLMLPAVISASCAFMLPIGTPPNAIVFGSGHVPLDRMAREGLAINLFGVAIVTLVCYLGLR